MAYYYTDKELINELKINLSASGSAAIQMAGVGTFDDKAFIRVYNTQHRLDYFNPYTPTDIHIFITRPFCNFNGANIMMDSLAYDMAHTQEGCLLLASLMEPSASGNVDNANTDKFAKGNTAYNNIKKYGLSKDKGIGFTPFIPLYSNMAIGISGLKDIAMEKYEYDGDQTGNKTADAMGLDSYKASGEVTIPCMETANSCVTMLTHMWMLYTDHIAKGTMIMRSDLQEECIYDYMSALYWFVTGRDGMSIVAYGKLTGCFPIDNPISSLIPSERGSSAESKRSFTFHYNHPEFMNPNIIFDFNNTIKKCAEQSGKTLETDVATIDATFNNWRKVHFAGEIKSYPTKTTHDGQSTEKMYRRTIATGTNLFGSVKGIFHPEIQNQWAGHPYIIDGKLLYMSIESSGALI